MDIGGALLPLLSLLLGVTTSAYFLVWWLTHCGNHHGQALLLWSAALFLFYWFQVPFILANFGIVVTLTDSNTLFTLAFPATFAALVLIYLGIIRITGIYPSNTRKVLLFLWFAIIVLFYAYYFLYKSGAIANYDMPILGTVMFFMPIRLFIIFKAAQIFYSPTPKNIHRLLGSAAIIGDSLIAIIRNFLILKTSWVLPPEFWYVELSNSRFLFISQSLSVLLLAVGFYFLHRAYHK